ncbi:MAG: DUF87 domain-containing protein [Candidatus Nanoarchaeia archaeon]|nr:DUF87 domain-containing protein [Candidatus Nanoarchaeia archaeon]
MTYDIILGRDEKDKDKYGTTGAIYLGKQYITMGKEKSLANRIMLDVVRPHVVYVVGKRGSGKSYTLSVVAESFSQMPQKIANNLAGVMIDTMGIFWTMKYPNFRDEPILRSWDLKPQECPNVIVFAPKGKFKELKSQGVPVDYPFSLTVSELSGYDWCIALDIKPTEPVGILIERVVAELKEQMEETHKKFDLDDMMEAFNRDETSTKEIKEATINRFIAVKSWGLFEKEGTPIDEIVQRGMVSVIDVSPYAHTFGAFSIRALVVGLLMKKLLEVRMLARKIEELSDIEKGWTFFEESYTEKAKKQIPLVWVFIDEVHQFLPKEGDTLATAPLLSILREGRQPGISVAIATQQPGKVHSDVITQCDIVIGHRMTAKLDLASLTDIMSTYLSYDITKYVTDLSSSKGSAVVLDDKQERIYSAQVRPKMSWHGGESPSAMPPTIKKETFEEDEEEKMY